MAAHAAGGRDAGVRPNLTPMIDVVFQLIIVFLCSMKFRTLDSKIEADLPERGASPIRVPAEPPRPCAAVHLLRPPGAAGTRVLLLDAAVGPAGEGAWAALQARLRVLRGRDERIYGEIDADPDVPHGEVMRALDAFVGASYGDVRFRGGRPAGGR